MNKWVRSIKEQQEQSDKFRKLHHFTVTQTFQPGKAKLAPYHDIMISRIYSDILSHVLICCPVRHFSQMRIKLGQFSLRPLQLIALVQTVACELHVGGLMQTDCGSHADRTSGVTHAAGETLSKIKQTEDLSDLPALMALLAFFRSVRYGGCDVLPLLGNRTAASRAGLTSLAAWGGCTASWVDPRCCC